MAKAKRAAAKARKAKPAGFSVGECISYGWETTKRKFGFLFKFQLILLAIYVGIMIVSVVMQMSDSAFSKFVANIFIWIIDIIIGIGIIAVALKISDGKTSRCSDIVGDTSMFWKYLGGSILYALIVLGGLILLVIPGIVWAVKYQFWAYFLVDKRIGPVEALKRSGKITMNRKWQLFGFDLTLVGIYLLGAIALLIGLFWAFPTILLATVYAYRKLSSLSKMPK